MVGGGGGGGQVCAAHHTNVCKFSRLCKAISLLTFDHFKVLFPALSTVKKTVEGLEKIRISSISKIIIL